MKTKSRNCFFYSAALFCPNVKTLFFLLFIVFQLDAVPGLHAQTGEQLQKEFYSDPVSPTAGALGEFGQVPVSLFNGLSEISIPMGKVSANGIDVNVSLDYHGGGIRPDHHSSWVGVGWALQAGGLITRKQNGETDEYLYKDHNPETQIGYFYHPEAGTGNWSSEEALDYYRSTAGDVHVLTPAPDEFVFNFGPYQGSFFFSHEGKWQVRSSTPVHLKIEMELADEFQLTKQKWAQENLAIKRTIYGFIVTTPNGCKYTFGKTPASIEFTRPAKETAASSAYHAEVVSTAWHLTKIVTPEGQEINFTYERSGIQIVVYADFIRRSWRISELDPWSAGNQTLRPRPLGIINPSYLKTISTANETITFDRSSSDELEYDYVGSNLDASHTYKDLNNPNGQLQIETDNQTEDYVQWLKLDKITFSNSTGVQRTIDLTFNNSVTGTPTQRLRLDKVTFKGADGTAQPPYEFFYNSTPLPGYNSEKLDHWGFYNGERFFDTHTGVLDDDDVPAYTTSRDPDASFMEAGILEQIKYPTGGKLLLDYEPHNYSSKMTRLPFNQVPVSGNTIAGGVRIKKVQTVDAFGAVETSREYFYVNNYAGGGTQSSGILSGEPDYMDDGILTNGAASFIYFDWFDKSIQPLDYTNGNHVTYTEVTEKFQDGSFTVYKYSNHDQAQYRDISYVNELFNTQDAYRRDEVNSRQLERGLLLQKTLHNKIGTLVKKIEYQYTTDPARVNEAIRSVHVTHRTFGSLEDNRAIAYLIYTYPTFNTKIIETEYDQAGLNPNLRTVDMAYNNTYRLRTIESVTNSRNQIEKVYYRYPFDVINYNYVQPVSHTEPLPYMLEKNIISTPLEIINTRVIGASEYVTDSRITSFRYWTATQVRPYQRYSFKRPSAMLLKSQYVNYSVTGFTNGAHTELMDPNVLFVGGFNNYDVKGNLIQYNLKNNIPNSFEWDYNKYYNTVKIVNAENTSRTYDKEIISTPTGQIVYQAGQFHTQSVTFDHQKSGNIELNVSYGGYPGTTQNTKTVTYTLSGPASRFGQLCLTNTGTGCGVLNPSVVFQNMPTGTYTLSVNLSSDFSSPGATVNYKYVTTSTQQLSEGIKEFFYQGFEQGSFATTGPWAGRKFNLGDYQVPFVAPNNKTYYVNYHYRDAGVWKNITKQYFNNLNLTEGDAIDEVRVFPANSYITTYTYDPAVGMTSETDPNGITTFYEFDVFQRLKLVRDLNRNILKTFDYKYQQ